MVTAERLASLVACSWPRAELTTIAYELIAQASEESDSLVDELREFETNRERADRIWTAIFKHEPLGLTKPGDRLAVKRMEKLITAPRRELLAAPLVGAGIDRITHAKITGDIRQLGRHAPPSQLGCL